VTDLRLRVAETDEKKGVSKVSIDNEVRGRMNPQVAAIQRAGEKTRHSISAEWLPLKKC
jgi:hypothetical protein